MSRRVIGALLLVSGVIAACGGGTDAGDAGPSTSPLGDSAVPAGATLYPDAGHAPAWLVELHPPYATDWSFASPAQREVLTDGDLTFAEYEQAALAEVQCLKDAGLELRAEPTYDEVIHAFTWSASGDGLGDPDGPLYMAMDGCNRAHASFLRMVWAKLHEPTQADRSDAIAFLAECLVEAGYVNFPQPGAVGYFEWYTELNELGDTEAAGEAALCMGETSRRFGFVP